MSAAACLHNVRLARCGSGWGSAWASRCGDAVGCTAAWGQCMSNRYIVQPHGLIHGGVVIAAALPG